MNRALLFSFVPIVVLVCAPLDASAVPIVTYTATPLTGGLAAYDVYLEESSGQPVNWFAQDWSFTGDLKQTLAFGKIAVMKESEADNYDSLFPNGSGYKKLEDTWVGNAFVAFPQNPFQNPPLPNPLDQPGLFYVNAGSEPGNQFAKVLLVHIVAGGPVQYEGFAANSTLLEWQPRSGVLAIPEPSTGVLAAIAGCLLCLLRKRFKRR